MTHFSRATQAVVSDAGASVTRKTRSRSRHRRTCLAQHAPSSATSTPPSRATRAFALDTDPSVLTTTAPAGDIDASLCVATPLFRHVDTPLGLSVRVLGDVDARSSAMPAVVRNNGVRMNAATFAECEGGYT